MSRQAKLDFSYSEGNKELFRNLSYFDTSLSHDSINKLNSVILIYDKKL